MSAVPASRTQKLVWPVAAAAVILIPSASVLGQISGAEVKA